MQKYNTYINNLNFASNIDLAFTYKDLFTLDPETYTYTERAVEENE